LDGILVGALNAGTAVQLKGKSKEEVEESKKEVKKGCRKKGKERKT